MISVINRNAKENEFICKPISTIEEIKCILVEKDKILIIKFHYFSIQIKEEDCKNDNSLSSIVEQVLKAHANIFNLLLKFANLFVLPNPNRGTIVDSNGIKLANFEEV